MKFAKAILKNRDARHYTFVTYLKQIIYNLFDNTRFQLDWKEEENRKKANNAVSKLMDNIFLHKRISFLEEAITILMEKHQLKGLHLIQHLNEEEVNRRHQSYQFRERVLFYINKYREIVEETGKKKNGRMIVDLSDTEKELKGG